MGDSTDDILLELQPLVPTFHGVIHGEKNGSMAKCKFYILVYSPTCIKRSALGHRKDGLIRQVTS